MPRTQEQISRLGGGVPADLRFVRAERAALVLSGSVVGFRR
jgi:hypothetical protein